MGAATPTETAEYDGEVVRRYNLPIESETPTLMLDVSEGGYDVEWFSDIDVEDFLTTVRRYASDSPHALATFDTGCRSTFRDERDLDSLLSENDRYFPGECSYLRVENSSYSIGWEREEGRNSIVLSENSSNTTPLEVFVGEIGVMAEGESISLALEQAEEIIRESN